MTMTAKVAEGRAAETEPSVFHYTKPDVSDRKVGVHLAATDRAVCVIQVLNHGGENNLHAHAETDGFWFVLKGRVRFYTTDDEFVAELGENEGISTPRGYRYWFEAVPGDEDLELLRFAASVRTGVNRTKDRINLEELKNNQAGLLAEKDELIFELEAK